MLLFFVLRSIFDYIYNISTINLKLAKKSQIQESTFWIFFYCKNHKNWDQTDFMFYVKHVETK